MPYKWLNQSSDTIILWPHRSLSPMAFAVFIGVTAALSALLLVTQLGTPGLWVLLPFLVAAVAGIWVALRLSYRTLSESLTLTATEMRVIRHTPRKANQVWQANPHWVRVHLRAEGGPVPDYLTLSGGGREVELGAFLAPEERASLYTELSAALAGLG